MNIKRYEISAYCHRCGSAEGSNAVVVEVYEDNFGRYVSYIEYEKIKKELDELKRGADEKVIC